MNFQFFKNNYGSQIVYLLLLSFVGTIIFSTLSIVISTAIYGVSIDEIQETSRLLAHKNARQILFLMIISQTFGMIILPILVFTQTVFESPKKDLKLTIKFHPIFLYTILFFSLSGIIIVGFLGEINMKIPLPNWAGEVEKEVNNTIEFILSPEGNLSFLFNVILLAIIPAIGEELFFRGILQKLFTKTVKSKFVAILITAAIFSAFHFQFQTFLPRFFMGIMLGYLFLWSGSLLVPIIAHFLHNFISVWITKMSVLQELNIETEETNYVVLLISVFVFGGLSYWYYNIYKKNKELNFA